MRKNTKIFAEKTTKELEKELVKMREEIAKMSLSQKTAPTKDTNALFKKRKQLAVLLTVLGEKKTAEKLKTKV